MDNLLYEKLMSASIRFVSFRPRSEKELRDFCLKTLKRHHTTAPLAVNQVMIRLQELGYADDKKFVDWWVGQRASFRPKGKRALEMELRAKGIKNPEINIDERQLAKKAIERKLGTLDNDRLKNYLYRRGFDPGVVDDVLGKE